MWEFINVKLQNVCMFGCGGTSRLFPHCYSCLFDHRRFYFYEVLRAPYWGMPWPWEFFTKRDVHLEGRWSWELVTFEKCLRWEMLILWDADFVSWVPGDFFPLRGSLQFKFGTSKLLSPRKVVVWYLGFTTEKIPRLSCQVMEVFSYIKFLQPWHDSNAWFSLQSIALSLMVLRMSLTVRRFQLYTFVDTLIALRMFVAALFMCRLCYAERFEMLYRMELDINEVSVGCCHIFWTVKCLICSRS